MRSKWIFLIALPAVFFVNASFIPAGDLDTNPPEGSATLTVEVTNIKNTNGRVQIGLYNSYKMFPKVGKTYRMERIKPTGKTLKYKFTGLPPGKYAIAIYHDENGDKKCNKNLIGVPTEAYAFSRNFRPSMSAPKFSDCYITLKEARLISIRLVY
ncbi:MAG: DUF2141 domain-containing protein [bacterium]|nr:DUF2141 domain-containing protein [bacterium]